MAEDCIVVMGKLGFDRFSVMGHDRGARVAYRMALDHPEVVNKLVLLDIVSTYDMYALSSAEFAKALFHWYLLTPVSYTHLDVYKRQIRHIVHHIGCNRPIEEAQHYGTSRHQGWYRNGRWR